MNFNVENKCNECGSISQVVIREEIIKRMTVPNAIVYILLLMIPVFGWIVLLIMLVKQPKTDTITSLVCQSCGNKVIMEVS